MRNTITRNEAVSTIIAATNSIVGELYEKPEYRFVDKALIAAITNHTCDALIKRFGGAV